VAHYHEEVYAYGLITKGQYINDELDTRMVRSLTTSTHSHAATRAPPDRVTLTLSFVYTPRCNDDEVRTYDVSDVNLATHHNNETQ